MLKKINNKSALFQMDPFNELNIKTDSTISILKEALQLKVKVYITSPEELTMKNNNVFAYCKRISINKSNLSFGKKRELNINSFDYFFIRQDPPFDMKYLTNCYLLELHQNFNQKPKFINDPGGIKNFTEKIFPIYFYKLMPNTIITSDEVVFKEILAKRRTLVLKTLYNKGGEGIVKVDKSDNLSISKFNELKNKYKVPVMVQDFEPKVSDGDKRVILLEGSPVGLINRVPKKGDFKANLHLGGKAKESNLTKKELEICNKLKPFLLQNNLFFVGIDLINEKLTEINVTSPTGIVQIQELTGVNIAKKLWSKLLNT